MGLEYMFMYVELECIIVNLVNLPNTEMKQMQCSALHLYIYGFSFIEYETKRSNLDFMFYGTKQHVLYN